MLVFSEQKLVLFAVPKTGTTALESALKPMADIAFQKHRKHMNVRRYNKSIRPFLSGVLDLHPETIAVMRDPLSQLRSWYRYRRANARALGMKGVNFDEFIYAVISDDPPKYASVGSQLGMLRNSKDNLGVTHLFAYERQPALREFFNNRMGEDINIKVMNVSPDASTPIKSETKAALRAARSDEFALYDRLMQSDGYLHTLNV